MVFEINDLYWIVRFVNPHNHMLLMDNGKYTVGTTDIPSRTIYIADNLSSSFLRDVLKHEICHSAIASYGYIIGIDEEECLCQVMEHHGKEIDKITDELLNNIL